MRSDLPYLALIRDSADKIFEYIEVRDKEEFLNDDLVKDACLTRLIVIGEYSAKVSDKVRDSFSEVEWQEMRAARNFFAHAYGRINWEIIWDTITIDLPKLRANIQKIIDHIEEEK